MFEHARASGVVSPLVLVVLLAPDTAAAQQAGVIEEVIVTAQKREQRLQDVPIAVSAFSGDFMDRLNVKDYRGLVDVTPGFSGRTEDSFNDALSIRGISTNDFGIGGDPSVGIFYDGFYEGRTGGAILSLLDVERAEIVKGPQGTLFGRNAIAGAISIISNKPTDQFEAKVHGAIEEFDHYEATGTVNIPLTDRWYFRASAHHLEDDGYLRNLAGGADLGFHDRDAAQAALRWAGDSLDVNLQAFYEDRESSGSVYWHTTLGLPEDAVVTDLGDGTIDESEIFRFLATAVYDFANGYSLTGIAGYKTYNYFYLEDYDATALNVNDYLQENYIDYTSAELRLNSPDEGPVTWFVGASLYEEDVDGRFASIYTEDDMCRAIVQTEVGDLSPDDFTWPPGSMVTGCDDPLFEAVWDDDIDPADLIDHKSETSFNDADYEGWALYGELTWAITERLDLTAGARYTYDKKRMGIRIPNSGGALGNIFAFEFFTRGFVFAEESWDDFTPRLALTWAATDAVTLYGNVSSGYKSGGFATFGLVLPGDPLPSGRVPPGTEPKVFDPEEVLSIEVGAKTVLLDNRLQANISIYDYQYDDLQLVFFEGGSSQVDNVAEASGFGIEADIRLLPTENWDLYFTIAYADTEIEKVDQDFLDAGGCDNCAGNELWFSPDWSTAAIVTYRVPVGGGREWFITGEHLYEDEKFAGPDNLALATTPSWDEVNLRLGYETDSWTATLYVENLFDEVYFERGWENADADNLFGFGLVNTLVWPSKPRTFGLSLGYRFE